ncbi:MAG: creatininase family protein [Nitrososphaerales archaeon]|jgi:creatinine amidohydrolase
METLYQRLTPDALLRRLQDVPVAYLPLGTLEYHGPHLPLGSDMLQPIGLFSELAKVVGGVVLPPLALGPDEATKIDGTAFYGMDFEFLVGGEKPRRLPGSAYYLDGPVFQRYVEGMLKQLGRAGVRVVVGHGHGPSTDLFVSKRGVWEYQFGLKVLTLHGIVPESELGFMIDHAGANETSIMLATNPELVKMENLPGNPKDWPLGIMGADPRVYASAELGRRIIDANLSATQRLLREELAKL